MKHSTYAIVAAAAALIISGCNSKSNEIVFDYEALNAQAAQEYLQPVHPGVPGETPFWNIFSTKYIYAPVFSFEAVDGATNYCLSIPSGEESVFVCNNTPVISLSPIWAELPVGWLEATMQATGADGKAVGDAVSLKFEKDNPFCGPYPPAPRGYREAAIMGAEYLHKSAMGQSWLPGPDPSLEYRLNCYACKIWSGTIQTELFLASHKPEYKDEAMQIARNAAECLMKNAQPADAPLAFFPPTYYYTNEEEGIQGVLNRNVGNTMFLEAVYAATALMDMYDATGEQRYLDFAANIANTYKKLQAQDGSWPVKVKYETGEPLNGARCLPSIILRMTQRLNLDRKSVV